MRFKKTIIFTIVVIALVLLNLIPNGATVKNDSYYKDLEYLGFYNSDNFSLGINFGVNNAPLNTNHVLLLGLKMFGKDSVSTLPLTIFYWLIIILSLYLLSKALKNFWVLAVSLFVFLVITKTNFNYLNTVLPYAGMFTFLVATIILLFYAHIKNIVSYPVIITISVFAVAFGLYDNITAACAIVLGLLIIRMYKICKNKSLKITAITCGLAVIVVCTVFCSSYKGVSYDDNIKSGVENGISLYTNNLSVTNYKQMIGYYITHIQDSVQHIQKILNNAFFEPNDVPFSFWHFIKKRFIPVNVLLFTLLIVVCLVFLIICWKKNKADRGIIEIIFGNVLIAVMSLKLTGFMYGITNLYENLMLFNLAFDMLICSVVVYIVYILKKGKNDLKEKYGVTQ